ncbi:MAG: FG-GAP-like repeat-containing protein [Acidobacteriota bacterium]|nr:FG-GAP-like repeat-containing protein [Acidobacteriota bacterium]
MSRRLWTAMALAVVLPLLTALPVSATTFINHTITDSAIIARSVYAVDLDGDSDMDMLSASYSDDKIAWYENDGSENFTAHTITTAADGAWSVYAVDVDGDLDMDVLSASYSDDKIVWYENDGSENFTAHTITTAADAARSVYAVDLDGDLDMDVLSASSNDNKIAWYENDGSENFTAHTITTAATTAFSVYAVDVDGDLDMDVLSADSGDHAIVWYENDGSENFTAHIITTTANTAYSVYAVDVDGDSDMDVLSASEGDDKIAWYENDGSENFTAHTITTAADAARSVFAVDVDGDSDMDVLSASYLDGKIAWYENDGSENFSAHIITTAAPGAFSVFAVDADGDSDVDVLSASYVDNKIVWYENVGGTLTTLALHPTGDGGTSEFVPAGAASAWDGANDQTGNAGAGPLEPYDPADYSIGAEGQRAMFSLDDGTVPAGATITEIIIRAQVYRGNGGGANAGLSYQRMPGATTPDASPVDGTGIDLTTGCCTEISETLIGLNWTTDDLDNLEIGMIHNIGGSDSYITQMYVLVSYVPVVVLTSVDLQVVKTVDNSTPNESDTIIYTVTVTNNGPDAGTGIAITDPLPAGVTYVSDTPSQGSYVSGTGVWTVGGLANAAGATLDITVTVDVGTGGTSIDNTASVSAVDQTDPVPANDSDVRLINVAGPYEISGTVFEDIVGDVLDDGAIGDANNPGAVGVDVYLYLDDGDSGLDAGDTLIGGAPQPTNASGNYSFTGLADGDYFVVVDSKTVGSTQDPLAVLTDIWAEQTYGPVGGYYDNGIGFGIRVSPGPCYGGIAGNLSDDFSQWDDREHRAALTISGADVANVDFGFSFNVVVNLVGGNTRDDDGGANRTVQGSLRQFIQNANAISAANAMRFVPAESPGTGDGSGHWWWRLMVTAVLPTIIGDGTTVDGRAFDHIDGTTLLNPNAAQIGVGLPVGTEGTYTTPKLDPELEIRNFRSTAVLPTGLVFEATDSVLRHVSIWGFGDSAGSFDANVRFGTNFSTNPDFTGSLVEFNVIGTDPGSFSDPGAADRSGQKNLTMRETDNAIVRDNLIGFAGGAGVDFNSASNSGLVLRNEIRHTGILNPIAAPASVWISGSVTGNLITDNASGIYSGPTPGISYQDNTITANGWGVTRPNGIYASGSSETIQRNIIADNAGAAVVVPSTTTPILVTRNSIHGNGTVTGQIGIDLLASGDDPLVAPFVTVNDDGDVDAGGNGLLNYPVLDTVQLQGADLIVTGWARPASQIEFYMADPDPLSFGEGETWLITKTEGAGDDTDAAATTYGPGAVNGILQGTATTNRFSFTIPIASLAAPVVASDELTALAILGGVTSEFGGNVTVETPTVTISGTVFEDADFAGTASNWDTGVNDLGLDNVDVELYDGLNAYVTSVTTTGGGTYTFTGLSDDTYKVRVRSATIGDADTPPAGGLNGSVPGTWPYPLAEMTWGHGSALVGGQDPQIDDSTTADNAGPGDTWVSVTVSGADVSEVDLGFCYDVIVNEADDANTDDIRSKQGCLRQFIKNSNAIAGINKSWFQGTLP